MARFEAQKIDKSSINSGERFQNGDIPTAEVFNAPIEAILWAEEAIAETNDEIGYTNQEISKQAEQTRILHGINKKKISALEREIYKDGYFVDDDHSYTKQVPENAAYYAEVTKIGGFSYQKDTNNLASWASGTYSFNALDGGSANDFVCTISGDEYRVQGVASVSGKYQLSSGMFGNAGSIKLSAGKTYTLSGAPKTNGSIGADGYYPPWYWQVSWERTASTAGRESAIDSGNGVTFTPDTSTIYLNFYLNVEAGTRVDITFRLMCNEGSVDLPFETQAHLAPNPIKEIVGTTKLVVPQSILDLKGFGQGYGDVFNYLEWSPDKGIAVYHRVCETRYESKLSLGLSAIYSYEQCGLFKITEEVTDVSNLIGYDNLIMVEPDGEVVFENDLEADVPSEIVYLIKENA